MKLILVILTLTLFIGCSTKDITPEERKIRQTKWEQFKIKRALQTSQIYSIDGVPTLLR